MKIVAVMMMRNEADVIESWVRYYIGAVDHIIITDHLSVDGSGDLVRKLIAEGLPISLEIENRPGYLQEERMKKMMLRAFFEFEADWVLLLDADEFLIPPAGRPLRYVFNELRNDRPLKVAWTTYIPTESDPDEPNVLKRVTHRLDHEVKQVFKVMIPAKIGREPEAVIEMGSHNMRLGKRKVKLQDAPSGMSLAHFPVRSKEQIASKVMVGWLATLTRPEYCEGQCYHWKLLFDNFLNNERGFSGDLGEIAFHYLGGTKEEKGFSKVVNGPIEGMLTDFAIRYPSDSTCNPLKLFAQTAEEIALKYGQLNARVALMESSPKTSRRNLLAALSGVLSGRK